MLGILHNRHRRRKAGSIEHSFLNGGLHETMRMKSLSFGINDLLVAVERLSAKGASEQWVVLQRIA
ncbi:hypothetical protein BpHYR1_044900 [Brachionus plicatilis]|uniref:Uncharacterized protein n=1 Tax=Brachionus plicatilis TaxID=10195 RepID=A0A3M7P2A9_BRAPC|nr:hypothetical protein BpHYR1_044900 [Brachionus plicatilis]